MTDKKLLELNSLENFSEIVKNGFSIIYLSRPACGVCSVLKEKIRTLLDDFPEIKSYYINMDKIEESAGYFSVFTIPAIILYIDGKETIREARYISIEKLNNDIKRIYTLYKA